MKHLFTAVLFILLFTGCRFEENQLIKIEGSAQGTTYHISYYSSNTKSLKVEIDSILHEIDQSLSTYVPESIISRSNKNEKNVEVDEYFTNVFNKSMEVSEKTNGYFDITVAPIINAWGFGFTKKANVDSVMIDSLLQYVGYKKVKLNIKTIVKQKPEVMLDMNAIAQGYSVDLLAAYLEKKGIKDYMIELGGELLAKGKKNNGDFWKIGIDKPVESNTDERTLQATVNLNDRAMATSGNYRKFYEENGQKYAHIIDPHTGYPAKNNLLSASVFANDCMTADAYATAFMVMGLEKSKQFLIDNPSLQLEVFFVYDEKGELKTYTSESVKKWVKEIH